MLPDYQYSARPKSILHFDVRNLSDCSSILHTELFTEKKQMEKEMEEEIYKRSAGRHLVHE